MTNFERIYRILLKAYPARYLREYGESMAQLFADQLRSATTSRDLLRLWIRTLADLARTVPARYAETFHGGIGIHRFTKPGRRSIFFARYEASSFGKREITTEHLLLGILREDRKLARTLLGDNGVDDVRREIEAFESSTPRVPQEENLPLSMNVKRVIAAAIEEFSHSEAQVDARHLLAGILQQDSSLAAKLLQRHGIDLARLRSRA